MVFWRRLWTARRDVRLREKLLEMATEFCLEASVLIGVLGILDSAVSSQRVPSTKVFLLSLGAGGFFFTLSCIIQALKISGSLQPDKPEDIEGE